MSTFAIGDIQGCFLTLERLLQRCEFDPTQDRLWLAGDLVNRGPRSLQVLRWARQLGDAVTTVLGNHDLNLLCRSAGIRPRKERDTLEEVLSAPDREELLEWLRKQPLVHREGEYLLVHAGLLPAWTPEQAVDLARRAEKRLRGSDWVELLKRWRSKRDQEPTPRDSTVSLPRVLDAFTRLRTCTPAGHMDHSMSGPPEQARSGHAAWFAHPGRRAQQVTVVFGHWAALGLHRAPGLLGLDTGCVWGGTLSAVRLEDGQLFQESLGD